MKNKTQFTFVKIRGRQYAAFYRPCKNHAQMVGQLVELVRVLDDVRVWPKNK